MSHRTRESVIRAIEESFAKAVPPGDDRLFPERVLDLGNPDIPIFEDLLIGKTWQQTFAILQTLQGPAINFYEDLPGYLTLEALQYFAPAFLLRLLAPEADNFGEAVLSEITPGSTEYRSERFRQLMFRFTDRQKQAVALTIDHLFRKHKKWIRKQNYADSARRLLAHWSRWLPPA